MEKRGIDELVRYRSKSGKYSLDKKYEPRNLYRILKSYGRPLSPYRRKPLGTRRRGYSSGARAQSYTPSRGTQHQRQSTQPTYRQVPKQSATSYPRTRREETHYRVPSIEPDTEQMIKQLGKSRSDRKLHEQVLEKLEAEIEKLRETLYKERAEREEIDEMIMRANEAFLEEHKNELIEKLLIGDMDNPETKQRFEVDNAKSETKTEEIETTQNEPKEISEAEELDHEPHETDESPESLRELESPLEKNEDNEVTEPKQIQEPESESIEVMASQESVENAEPGVSEATLENPVEIGVQQLQNLEPLLDQIKPVEKGIEIAPEILPENIEEQALEEEEAY